MKKTIVLLLMLILIPTVYSIYGGETWKYHFDECKELEVNVTATGIIDEGEYTILNNCTENGTNYHLCDCKNGYNFTVKFHPGAVNNYTFEFNYMYERFVEEPDDDDNGGNDGSSGGTSGSSFTTTLYPDRPFTKYILPYIISRFRFKNILHTFKVTNVSINHTVFEMNGNIIKDRLYINEPKDYNIDDDNELDITLTLQEIRGRTSIIEFKPYQERRILTPITTPSSPPPIQQNDTQVQPPEPESVIQESKPKSPFSKLAIIIIVGLIVILLLAGTIIGVYYLKISKSGEHEQETDNDSNSD